MGIPDHAVPVEFRDKVLREIDDARVRALQIMEEYQVKCPVDNCGYHPSGEHGLRVHMARSHREVPRPDRDKMIEEEVLRDAEEAIERLSEDHGEVVVAESKNELVNHPAHYNTGSIEVIDAIEDWDLGFHEGNAVKYIARAKFKGSELQDLQKAAWYILRRIEQLANTDGTPDTATA